MFKNSRLALVVLSVAALRGTGAQSHIGADATWASNFMFRGVSVSDVPIIQPQAWALRDFAGGTAMVLGGFAEETHSVGSSIRSLNPEGMAHPIIEWWASADYTHAFGPASATVGGQLFRYPAATHIGAQFNTEEVYARVAFEAPAHPSVTAYYDVRQVLGSYIETGLAQSFEFDAERTFDVSATAGFSAGQSTQSRGSAYFAKDGLAFVGVTAGITVPVGKLVVSPAATLQYNRDQWARATGPGLDGSTGLNAMRLYLTTSIRLGSARTH
jgi:hypothetical protein